MTTSQKPDSGPALEALVAAARAELEELDARIAPLLSERSLLQDRVTALEHVLSLYTNGAAPRPVPNVTRGEIPGSAGSTQPKTGSIRETVRDQVRAILADADGAPMHIIDIHSAFETRGWKVPGAGSPANITAHLSNCPDIHSPKRGFWTLGADPDPRPKRRKRAKKSTKSRQPAPRSEGTSK